MQAHALGGNGPPAGHFETSWRYELSANTPRTALFAAIAGKLPIRWKPFACG
jgi:hypothetical protein